ncbi:DUF6779 domain-containing protein [uncultured Corynebacterium sp.]|uniref:DUF6779 domain-containing protein n=1 Tax=uncultured Corynebacterium sp. TaxID=159447 RepID=UPI0025E6C530|nr:DUF6779 domain-containing protein [uncultured Corynebacterium sp.]
MSFQPQSNERPHRHRSTGPSNGYGLEKTKPAPSSSEGGLSKVLMIGLVALALIASVVTVMTDSEGWMKIAILAALWAAFIGVFLVVRYSSALKSEREQHSLREGEHRAEIEREKSRAREELARAESEFAQRAKATRDEQIEMLRAEVENLRNQLEGMGAGNLSDHGPRAVRARAERIVELENRGRREAGASTTGADAWPQPARSARPTEANSRFGNHQGTAQPHNTAQPQNTASRAGQTAGGNSAAQSTQRRNSGGFSTGSFAAVRWTGQDTEATAQIPLVVDTTTMNNAAQADKPKQPSGAAHKDQPERGTHASGRTGAHDPHHRPAHAGPAESTTGDAPRQPVPEETEDSAYRRGRRRADEGGLTVAELLQRAKNKKR